MNECSLECSASRHSSFHLVLSQDRLETSSGVERRRRWACSANGRLDFRRAVNSYIMVKRDCFLLVSSDFHFRSSSRSVTLDLLWYRCLTHLAPLRWTISMLLMSTLSCGSQTQLANSTVGLTIDVYAVSLVLVDAIFKFLLNNPRVLFALRL